MAKISRDGLFKPWVRRRQTFSLSGRNHEFPGEAAVESDEMVTGRHIAENTGGREASPKGTGTHSRKTFPHGLIPSTPFMAGFVRRGLRR
jgi:hypothetical protein